MRYACGAQPPQEPQANVRSARMVEAQMSAAAARSERRANVFMAGLYQFVKAIILAMGAPKRLRHKQFMPRAHARTSHTNVADRSALCKLENEKSLPKMMADMDFGARENFEDLNQHDRPRFRGPSRKLRPVEPLRSHPFLIVKA